MIDHDGKELHEGDRVEYSILGAPKVTGTIKRMHRSDRIYVESEDGLGGANVHYGMFDLLRVLSPIEQEAAKP